VVLFMPDSLARAVHMCCKHVCHVHTATMWKGGWKRTLRCRVRFIAAAGNPLGGSSSDEEDGEASPGFVCCSIWRHETTHSRRHVSLWRLPCRGRGLSGGVVALKARTMTFNTYLNSVAGNLDSSSSVGTCDAITHQSPCTVFLAQQTRTHTHARTHARPLVQPNKQTHVATPQSLLESTTQRQLATHAIGGSAPLCHKRSRQGAL